MKKILPVLIVAVVMIATFSACSLTGGDEVEASDVGEWITTEKKAESDEKYHEVKYRITKVERDQDKVKQIIEDYNTSGAGVKVDLSTENESTEICVAEYEVKFPKDFPDSDFGITDTTIAFEITGLDGSDVIKVDNTEYEGLSATQEVATVPQGYDFYSGSTYKGKIAFLMVKDCTDYCFSEGYEADGETVRHYTHGK